MSASSDFNLTEKQKIDDEEYRLKVERDEDERLDYQWDTKCEEAARADAHFAPSEGYR